jgi:diguanylate cyclase (GGDEF)-like protein
LQQQEAQGGTEPAAPLSLYPKKDEQLQEENSTPLTGSQQATGQMAEKNRGARNRLSRGFLHERQLLTRPLFSSTMKRMEKREKTGDNPIFVVDDNPVVLKLIASILEREGFTVRTTTSGLELLTLLESIQPDLILLDIDMPGISGIETCRRIKSDPRTTEIPILIVTASNDKEHVIAGFEAGAQDYIIKPSTKEELLARVRTHLALHKAQQALKASQARYRELSFIDDLTGLYNTRYLYKALQDQMSRHPEQALTIVFMDIDKFKQVVDTHGHLNGSRAIAELAAVVKPLLPDDCFAVSYGGDEFVAVLTGHDRQAGAQRAEQIRAAIADNRFLTDQDLDLHITVSCGIASYPQDAQSMVDLLGNADHALFETKRRGKNGVVTYAEMLNVAQENNFLPLGQG